MRFEVPGNGLVQRLDLRGEHKTLRLHISKKAHLRQLRQERISATPDIRADSSLVPPRKRIERQSNPVKAYLIVHHLVFGVAFTQSAEEVDDA